MTNAEARFNNSLRPRQPEGSLGRTTQDVHLYSHTAPELWTPLTRMTLALMWAGNCVGQFNVSTSFLTNIQSAKSSKPCSEDCCFRKSRHEHVRPLLKALHWLPVKDRIVFKIATCIPFCWCCCCWVVVVVLWYPATIPVIVSLCIQQENTGRDNQARAFFLFWSLKMPNGSNSEIYLCFDCIIFEERKRTMKI